jgi:hypothetical protein
VSQKVSTKSLAHIKKEKEIEINNIF